MTTPGFEGIPKFGGISGDHASVTAFYDRVLIRAVDTMAEEAVTISMTPIIREQLLTKLNGRITTNRSPTLRRVSAPSTWTRRWRGCLPPLTPWRGW